MAHATTTQHAPGTALDYVFRDNFVRAVYYESALLGLQVNGQPVFPRLPAGDTNYRWKVHSAGQTAATFTEGASMAVPGSQTFVNAAQAYTYWWVWVRITGHLRDAVKSAALPGLNAVAQEFIGAEADLMSAVNTGLMGSSNSGLEVSIDSTTTYAGIARGSATYWESQETAVSGALTKSALMDITEAQRDNDVGGSNENTIILLPHNQLTNYEALAGTPNTANHSARFEMSRIGGGSLNVASNPALAAFGPSPMIGIGNMTNTVILGLDLTPTAVGPAFGVSVRREFEIRGPVISADDDLYECSLAFTLANHSPKKCWKLTAVTA